MEPLSAIGLASSVLAFVDFSWHLITGTLEIYYSRSGSSAENACLKDDTDRMKSLAESLGEDVPGNTDTEKKIRDLANGCQKDSRALLALLEKMRVTDDRHGRWRSFKAKWSSILNDGEVKRLRERLQQYRKDTLLCLTVLLREDLSVIKKLQEDARKLNVDLVRQVTEAQDTLQNEIQKSLETTFERQTLTEQSLLSGIAAQLENLLVLIVTIPVQHRILRHLISEDIESRREQIIDAEAATCNWIFGEEPSGDGDSSDDDGSFGYVSESDSELYEIDEMIHDREKVHRDFIAWLRTGSGVLHISGKAGSGKSTLMKYIGGHERTRKELEHWAGDKTLIFGQFYFWISGSPSQRTLSGLHRSLLFQALRQCPDLIGNVFPLQFERMRSSRTQSDSSVEKLESFSDKQIRDAFDLLLQQTLFEDYRLCFLIDGLDEFEGNLLDHEKLAAKLKGWTAHGAVKLIVSSRPWQEFHQTFTSNEPLHLHRLNHLDIQTFCLSRIRSDKETQSLALDEMNHLRSSIISEIIAKSQGVFLWAHLVLDAILMGIRKGFSANELVSKVNEFPFELNDLYDKLREPIERSAVDRKKSNQMLLLAANVPKNFYLGVIAFSWLGDDGHPSLVDEDFPPTVECQPYSEKECARRLERGRKRIDGLARGLLEAVDSFVPLWMRRSHLFHGLQKEVRFCHRSARDYLVNNQERYSALQESWPDFDPVDVYGRIFLANFINGPTPGDQNKYSSEYWPPYREASIKTFSLRTIRRLEAPLLHLLRPRWSNRPQKLIDRNDKPVSFLHCAAAAGLQDFVLSEMAAHTTAETHSCELSVLVTAICFNHYGLASRIIEQGTGLDTLIKISTRIESGNTKRLLVVPSWVFALALIMQSNLNMFEWERFRVGTEKSISECFYQLHKLAAKAGQCLKWTFAWWEEDAHGNWYVKEEEDIGSDELARWLEHNSTKVPGLPADILEEHPLQKIFRRLGWDIAFAKNYDHASHLTLAFHWQGECLELWKHSKNRWRWNVIYRLW